MRLKGMKQLFTHGFGSYGIMEQVERLRTYERRWVWLLFCGCMAEGDL